jgi:hypothetical protein
LEKTIQIWTDKNIRTGNRACKNNVFLNETFSPQRNKHICKPNCAKFSRENLANFTLRVGFGFISLGHVDKLFPDFFSKQALQR